MKDLRNNTAIIVWSLLFIAVISFVACRENQPLSFTGTEDSETVLFKKGPGSDGKGDVDPFPESALLMTRKREENEAGVSKAVIGPAGGVLFHGDHRLEIAPGALDEAVELTFSMPVSTPDTLMFDLGPDGLTFNPGSSVKLVVSFDHAYTSGLDETIFDIVVYNPKLGKWQKVLSAVDTELNLVSSDEIVKGALKHFSRYAISKG
ncbi:MAG: hypothetical protein ACE5IR_13410 [bacterium]